MVNSNAGSSYQYPDRVSGGIRRNSPLYNDTGMAFRVGAGSVPTVAFSQAQWELQDFIFISGEGWSPGYAVTVVITTDADVEVFNIIRRTLNDGTFTCNIMPRIPFGTFVCVATQVTDDGTITATNTLEVTRPKDSGWQIPPPKGYKFPLSLRGFIYAVLTPDDYFAAGLEPFYQLDWPVPKGRMPGIITNRTLYTNDFNINQLLQVQPIGDRADIAFASFMVVPLPRGRLLHRAGYLFDVSQPGEFNLTVEIALTGTVTTATELDIITGGKTIILTLPSGYSWVTSGATFDAQRQNIINGLTSAQAEANGWNNAVKPTLTVGDVVRTSASVVTITLDAVPTYSITADETITASVPTTALTNSYASITPVAFTITNV